VNSPLLVQHCRKGPYGHIDPHLLLLSCHYDPVRLVLGIIFLAIAIVATAASGATPQVGPASNCGPINFFDSSFTVHADCRYLSVGEGAGAVIFFLPAVLAVLSARPRN
jgi:hypothetical protein